MKWSSVAGVLSGAPFSFQSGISSFRARGSSTAPESRCAPTSEPFSRTQTETSRSCSDASCFNRIAALRPAGPAPTITTSYSIISRVMAVIRIYFFLLPPAGERRRLGTDAGVSLAERLDHLGNNLEQVTDEAIIGQSAPITSTWRSPFSLAAAPTVVKTGSLTPPVVGSPMMRTLILDHPRFIPELLDHFLDQADLDSGL